MSPHNKVIILFAHPALQNSRVNIELMQAVRQMKGVTFHDLYERYPDFFIVAEEEQALLEHHDTIVLQFPLIWYSVPPIFRQWQDITLKHGWAYGAKGKALHGKNFLCAVTTGGREKAYAGGKKGFFTLPELLAPLHQSARLCGMNFLPPFVIHGTHLLTPEDIRAHASQYHRVIRALRDGRVDFEALENKLYFNSSLDGIIREEETSDAG